MARFMRKTLTRRGFLEASGGSPVAAGRTGCVRSGEGPEDECAAGAVDEAIASVPAGVQLCCFRHLLEEAFPGTLAEVATLVYAGVELAGYHDYEAAEPHLLPGGVKLQLDTPDAANGDAVVPEVTTRGPGRIKSMHVKPSAHVAAQRFEPLAGDDSLPREEISARNESLGGSERYVAECEEEESLSPPNALKSNRERVREYGS